MDIFYVIIITLEAYVICVVTKVFIDMISNKFILLQNVIVRLISAFVCYFKKEEPSLLKSIVIYLIVIMGAGVVIYL